MGVISELLRGAVDVVKDNAPQMIDKLYKSGIVHKEGQAFKNYINRVADAWVNQDEKNPGEPNAQGSSVKSLGDIMKEEAPKLGKQLLLGLLPIGPEIKEE